MLPSGDQVQPANSLTEVQSLAAIEAQCDFYEPVLIELRRHKLDTDDLREIIQHELGTSHCYMTAPTRKHYAGTNSDYYSIWINECNTKMFLKLLVYENSAGLRKLIVTSFKKDNRYA